MNELRHNGDLRDASLTLITRRQTDFQLVELFQHPVYGGQLVIDGDLQISESDFAYNAAMTAPLLTLQDIRRVAILGGGDGGVLDEVIKVCERTGRELEEAVLVDIDGEVIDLCRQYLPALCGKAFEHPRARVLQGDAFAWIDETRDLDAVIYDLTMEPVRKGVTREEFIHEILSKVYHALRPGGVFSMQACGEHEPEREQLLAEIRGALDSRFDERREQTVMIPSYDELWTFIAARKPA